MELLSIAYLDPGTGSMVVQSVIGAIVGAAYLGRNTINKLASAVFKKPTKDE